MSASRGPWPGVAGRGRCDHHGRCAPARPRLRPDAIERHGQGRKGQTHQGGCRCRRRPAGRSARRSRHRRSRAFRLRRSATGHLAATRHRAGLQPRGAATGGDSRPQPVDRLRTGRSAGRTRLLRRRAGISGRSRENSTPPPPCSTPASTMRRSAPTSRFWSVRPR